MKAVGKYVIIEFEDTVSESGIMLKLNNEGLVIDCKVDESLIGKRVLFNRAKNYITYDNYIFVDYEMVLGVME